MERQVQPPVLATDILAKLRADHIRLATSATLDLTSKLKVQLAERNRSLAVTMKPHTVAISALFREQAAGVAALSATPGITSGFQKQAAGVAALSATPSMASMFGSSISTVVSEAVAGLKAPLLGATLRPPVVPLGGFDLPNHVDRGAYRALTRLTASDSQRLRQGLGLWEGISASRERDLIALYFARQSVGRILVGSNSRTQAALRWAFANWKRLVAFSRDLRVFGLLFGHPPPPRAAVPVVHRIGEALRLLSFSIRRHGPPLRLA